MSERNQVEQEPYNPKNSIDSLRVALYGQDSEAISNAARNIQSILNLNLPTIESLHEELEEGVYLVLQEFVDKASDSQIKWFSNPDFDTKEALEILNTISNSHIMHVWERGDDPEFLITQSIRRYERLENQIEIMKLVYNRNIPKLIEAIQLEPEEGSARLVDVVDHTSRAVTGLDVLRKASGRLTSRSRETYYRENNLIPCDFRNAFAQARLDQALFVNCTYGQQNQAKGHVDSARFTLAQAREILEGVPLGERYNLAYLRREAANNSNLAYGYLIEADIELARISRNGNYFVYFLDEAIIPMHEFVAAIERKNPKPSNLANKEDKTRLPDDFGTEVMLRFAYGTALMYLADRVFDNWNHKMQSVRQEFFSFLAESVPNIGLDHIPQERVVALLAKTLLNRAGKLAEDPIDKAEVVKYTNLFRKFGI